MKKTEESKGIPTDVILDSIEKYSSDNGKTRKLTRIDCMAVIDVLFMEAPK